MLVTAVPPSIMGERHGSSQSAVVALHGWARSRRDWDLILSGQSGLALDLPGFGASPPPPHAWSTAEYAAALFPLADPGDPKVFVGHSFGGRVAVHLAAQRPAGIRHLVLTGVPLLFDPTRPKARPALQFRLARYLHQHRLLSAKTMDAYRDRFGSADYRAASGVMREILVKAVNETYADQLRAIGAAKLPTTLVWGEHDTAASLEVARAAQALIGDSARLVVVPGVGHLLEGALVGAVRAEITKVTQQHDS